MDVPYELTLVDGSVKTYQCETIEVTATTITGINTAREIVFVVPVLQAKLLSK
jgi:hypothetical protein